MNIDKPHTNLMAVMDFLIKPDIKPTLPLISAMVITEKNKKDEKTYLESII
jgi:hypothetical protein